MGTNMFAIWDWSEIATSSCFNLKDLKLMVYFIALNDFHIRDSFVVLSMDLE